MKKIISVVITFALISTLFVGCNKAVETTSSSSDVASGSSDISSSSDNSSSVDAENSSETVSVSSEASSIISSSKAISSNTKAVSSGSKNTSSSSKAASSTITSTSVAAVKSSVASGTYTSARTVVLTTATSGATIYYTTDGSDPTTISSKYTSAINISKTTTVKAFAVKNSFASKISAFAFVVNIPLNLSGTITYDGSSALAPLVDLASPMLKALYPNVSIPAAGTKGSGTGVSAVLAGTIDIGGSDVPASNFTDAISANKLVDHQICIIGFAAVIDKSLGIKNLTTAQLKKVFTDSTVTNWNQIDSSFPNKPITVVVRAAGSGTRVVFDSTALGGAAVRSDSVVVTGSSSGDVESKVNTTSGAIGYLALSYTISSAGTNVLPLSLNSIAPSYTNIYNGSYKIIGIEHIYTKGKPNAQVQAFIDYMTSSAFSSKIEGAGYGLVSKMQ